MVNKLPTPATLAEVEGTLADYPRTVVVDAAKFEEMQTEIEGDREEISSLRSAIVGLTVDKANAESTIERLRASLYETEKVCINRAKEIDDLQRTNLEQIGRKDAKIERLNTYINDLRAENAIQGQAVARHYKNLADARKAVKERVHSTLAEMTAKMSTLNGMLEIDCQRKEEQIDTLREVLALLEVAPVTAPQATENTSFRVTNEPREQGYYEGEEE